MRASREFITALESFEEEMHPEGPFFFGEELGWVDILIAPCKQERSPLPSSYISYSAFDRGDPLRTCSQALPRLLATSSIGQVPTICEMV